MKIKIIPEICLACGLCALHHPDLFDYYDNGVIKFKNNNENKQQFNFQLTADLAKTIKACPAQAIITEQD